MSNSGVLTYLNLGTCFSLFLNQLLNHSQFSLISINANQCAASFDYSRRREKIFLVFLEKNFLLLYQHFAGGSAFLTSFLLQPEFKGKAGI